MFVCLCIGLYATGNIKLYYYITGSGYISCFCFLFLIRSKFRRLPSQKKIEGGGVGVKDERQSQKIREKRRVHKIMRGKNEKITEKERRR